MTQKKNASSKKIRVAARRTAKKENPIVVAEKEDINGDSAEVSKPVAVPTPEAAVSVVEEDSRCTHEIIDDSLEELVASAVVNPPVSEEKDVFVPDRAAYLVTLSGMILGSVPGIYALLYMGNPLMRDNVILAGTFMFLIWTVFSVSGLGLLVWSYTRHDPSSRYRISALAILVCQTTVFNLIRFFLFR